MDTFEELTERLGSPWPWERGAAAEELGRLGDPRAVPVLLRALDEERFPRLLSRMLVRPAILRALGDSGDPAVIEPLCRALSAPGRRARRATSEALRALAARMDEPGPLIALLGSLPLVTDSAVVLAIAGGLFFPLSLPFLLAHRRRTWRARHWVDGIEPPASQALVRMGKPLFVPVLRSPSVAGNRDWLARVRAAYELSSGVPAPPGFSFLAETRTLVALLRAVGAEGRRGGRRVIRTWVAMAPLTIEPLFELLEGPDPLAGAWAAQALGTIGSSEVRGRLLGLLGGADAGRQLHAAIALGLLGDARAVPALAGALGHGEPEVRRAAAVALGRIGRPAREALVALHQGLAREGIGELRAAYQGAIRAIERALRDAPAELEAGVAPAGMGTELESAPTPAGRGTEPEGAEDLPALAPETPIENIWAPRETPTDVRRRPPSDARAHLP